MKHLLKTSLTILFVLVGMQAFSQSIILKAGLNLSTMQIKQGDINALEGQTFNPGFHVGALLDAPISEAVSIEAGVLVENRGYKNDLDFLGQTIATTYNPLYVDIPITVKFRSEINDGFSIFGQAGPYIGFGIGGNVKVETGGQEEKESIDWSDEDLGLKRLDYGLAVGAGVEIANIILGVGFDLGLANLDDDDTEDVVIRNRSLKVSAGFRIGGE